MRIGKLTICMTIFCILVTIFILIKKKETTELTNLRQLLIIAISASENGGRSILKNKDNVIIKQKGLTKEGLADKVTSADFISHCSMMGTLKKHYQYLSIISEESDAYCSDDIDDGISSQSLEFLPDEWVNTKDITVWIDPLDATFEFTEKLYQYVTTMVCIAVNGKPLIGVIHKPFENSTYWAWAGKTESFNLKAALEVDEHIKVTISRSHSGKIKQILNERLPHSKTVVAAGSGYKSLLVATREVDAYLHITDIKKWDICAGNAIINALGGKMTDKYGKDISYKKETNFVNERGLIATMKDHSKFLQIFAT